MHPGPWFSACTFPAASLFSAKSAVATGLLWLVALHEAVPQVTVQHSGTAVFVLCQGSHQEQCWPGLPAGKERGRKEDREGERGAGREGGREGEREGVREAGREGGKAGRKEGREEGRKGEERTEKRIKSK